MQFLACYLLLAKVQQLSAQKSSSSISKDPSPLLSLMLKFSSNRRLCRRWNLILPQFPLDLDFTNISVSIALAFEILRKEFRSKIPSPIIFLVPSSSTSSILKISSFWPFGFSSNSNWSPKSCKCENGFLIVLRPKVLEEGYIVTLLVSQNGYINLAIYFILDV